MKLASFPGVAWSVVRTYRELLLFVPVAVFVFWLLGSGIRNECAEARQRQELTDQRQRSEVHASLIDRYQACLQKGDPSICIASIHQVASMRSPAFAEQVAKVAAELGLL